MDGCELQTLSTTTTSMLHTEGKQVVLFLLCFLRLLQKISAQLATLQSNQL